MTAASVGARHGRPGGRFRAAGAVHSLGTVKMAGRPRFFANCGAPWPPATGGTHEPDAHNLATAERMPAGRQLPGADESPGPAYPDHAQLRMYLDAAGRQHPLERPADWAIRREHILAGMTAAMGPLPDRSHLPALDLRTDPQNDVLTDGVRRQTISFASGDGDRVTAYLYVPPHRPGEHLPAMLALHQTSTIGKGEVAGLGKSKNQGYGAELAARGYVVVAPDYPSFGDLQDYDFAQDQYVSGTMKGIFNHMRPSIYCAASGRGPGPVGCDRALPRRAQCDLCRRV